MKTNMKAIIFDMDGLLIDTEAPAKKAWQRAAIEIGESIDDETMDSLIGRHIEDCLDRLSEKLGRDLRAIEFMQKVDDIYYSNLIRDGIDVKKGVLSFLEMLREKQVPRAVATSTEKQIAPRKLRLAGLAHFFEIVVSGCDVAQSKPAPDIFLRTADLIGVDPQECIVLEDSYTGVQAAHAAGMVPVMIPDLLPATPEMELLTHFIFPSMEESETTLCTMLGIG